MAQTPTKIIPLGFKALDFLLWNPLLNRNQSLPELTGEKATVIVFMCNHCPFVIHILGALVKVSNRYNKRGVQFIGINSNDINNYPDDSPEKMIELIQTHNISFPYLFDESQEVAKNYSAACTPDFSIFNNNLKCVYRGQMDDARPGNDIPATAKDLCDAIERILRGDNPIKIQKPSLGCNIKWREE